MLVLFLLFLQSPLLVGESSSVSLSVLLGLLLLSLLWPKARLTPRLSPRDLLAMLPIPAIRPWRLALLLLLCLLLWAAVLRALVAEG